MTLETQECAPISTTVPWYEYLFKRVGSQETGSQIERGGKASRGRYLLISMDPTIQAMFPPLSDAVLNDQAVTWIDLLNKNNNRELVCCNYIYHNSKICCNQPNGRNEKRIYFPIQLDNKEFFREDILIFRRKIDQSDPQYYEYKLLWLRPTDPLYEKAKKFLTNGSYYLHHGYIAWFEKLNDAFSEPNKVVIDQTVVDRLPSKATTSGSNATDLTAFANLFSSKDFRNFVLTSYGYTCAVTKEVAAYKSLNNLDAAHIHPKHQGGLFLPTNGIAMRKDIHYAFDLGMFTVNDDLTIFVANELKSGYLGKYDGRKIAVVNNSFRPDPEFLAYHRHNIYRRFVSIA